LLATILTKVFNLQDKGVAVVGQLPAGLPVPGLPPLGDYAALLLPAAGVLLVGYTDNVLTGRAFAIRGGYSTDANQEFLALGAANVGAGLFQGFPVSSSGSRTAIGESAGARTQLHSLVAVVCVVIVLLFLRPVLATSRSRRSARSSFTRLPASSTCTGSGDWPGSAAASCCSPWSRWPACSYSTS
jgi:sulfate permease, SulP family